MPPYAVGVGEVQYPSGMREAVDEAVGSVLSKGKQNQERGLKRRHCERSPDWYSWDTVTKQELSTIHRSHAETEPILTRQE